MAQQSMRRDQENQSGPTCRKARYFDLDLIFELPYGPAALTAALEAGQMAAPRLRASNFFRDSSCADGGVHRWAIARRPVTIRDWLGRSNRVVGNAAFAQARRRRRATFQSQRQ